MMIQLLNIFDYIQVNPDPYNYNQMLETHLAMELSQMKQSNK